MKIKKIMPPIWLLISIVVMLAFYFIFPVKLMIPYLWYLHGFIPVILGVAINLSADRAFQQAKTTVKPFEESSALITNGVFRISRNPMYLGFVLILIGIAIFLRSLSPYLVIVLFVTVIDRIYIRAEERMLAKKFGTEWEEYKSSTRRWL